MVKLFIFIYHTVSGVCDFLSPPAAIKTATRHLLPCDMVHYKGHLCQSGVKNVINFGKIWLLDVSDVRFYGIFDGFLAGMRQICGMFGVSSYIIYTLPCAETMSGIRERRRRSHREGASGFLLHTL